MIPIFVFFSVVASLCMPMPNLTILSYEVPDSGPIRMSNFIGLFVVVEFLY